MARETPNPYTEEKNILDNGRTVMQSMAVANGPSVKEADSCKKSVGKGDSIVVDFDGPDDPSDPLNWNTWHKWAIVILVSSMNLMVNLATIICAPAAPQILAEFHSNNALYSTLLVSIWEIGEIFGPLVIAPLSELYGRLVVYQTANLLFIIFSIAGALSVNINMLIAFRCLNGLTVASTTLNAGTVADMFILEQRGTAMAIMGFSPLIGVITGPIIGGYLTEAKGWRWTFWIVTIITGAIEAAFILFLRETYKVTILQKKTNRLRKETGNQQLHSRYDTGSSGAELFQRSILRPAKMLFLSPIVFLISLYVAVVYSFLYLIITTLTETFEETYGFTQGPVGLTFLGLGIGMTGGVIVCAFTLDRFLKRQVSRAHGVAKPEQRLPPMIVGGVLLPIGLFVYGWTAQYHLHWIVPIIGTAILGFGLMITMIPASTYLVDVFTIYAASATAAGIVLKNLAGAVLPLAGPPMYSALRLGWGNSVLAFVALAFVPAPVLFLLYGERLRRSKNFRTKF